jgi:hypothetical protein
VKHSGQVLGRIVQEDHLCSFTPTYGIEGVSGITGLKLKGPPNSYAVGMPKCPSFDVYLMDESSVMGRISKQWVVFGEPSSKGSAPPEETYVVNFHPDMDLRTKCLLLSTVFMLVSKYRFLSALCLYRIYRGFVPTWRDGESHRVHPFIYVYCSRSERERKSSFYTK